MNTNAKHTPGPWRIIPHQTMQEDHGGETVEREFMSIESDTDMIAEIFPVYRPDPNEATLSKTANARLIAAAPAMLEALRYAAELIPTARRYFPKSVKFSDRFQLENVCATIGKAIHQAEGGEQ